MIRKKNLIKLVRKPELWEHRFEYGPDNKIQKETIYAMRQGTMVIQSYNLYYYSDGNLVKKEFYESTGIITRVDEMDYVGNLKVRSSLSYVHGGESRLNAFTKYSYDKVGHLISMDVFTGIGALLTSYSYEYSDNLLVTEVEDDRGRKAITTTYEYDNGKLSRKLKEGKVIQENLWQGSKLIERKEYDYGFDPCYHFCCGMTMIKIHYY